VALVFEYINGFHDTANSIATVVSTKVLTPRQAIVLAASTNLVGALVGHAVAKTVSSGLVDAQFVTNQTIVCALLGGIVWNLLTWWLGLPSSSTHALVGGLCGATLASAKGNWGAILWSVTKVDDKGVVKHEGVLHKVIVPMFTSPLIGFTAGLILMSLLYLLLMRARPAWVNATFGKLQLASAGYMGFAHGLADAQKTMGIIAVLLFSQGILGETFHVPFWVVLTCQAAMGLGTLCGGWRIVHTMGSKITRLTPMQGFCAETGGAITLFAATGLGVPVSTTHTITGAIIGVGAARRTSAVRWGVASNIVVAWVVTIPASGLIAAATYVVAGWFG